MPTPLESADQQELIALAAAVNTVFAHLTDSGAERFDALALDEGLMQRCPRCLLNADITAAECEDCGLPAAEFSTRQQTVTTAVSDTAHHPYGEPVTDVLVELIAGCPGGDCEHEHCETVEIALFSDTDSASHWAQRASRRPGIHTEMFDLDPDTGQAIERTATYVGGERVHHPA
jgi:hypothetical protein